MLGIMLWFPEIRKSIIKIQIMGGESKIIHKFEIVSKWLKYCWKDVKP